jgi:hypothetical protein
LQEHPKAQPTKLPLLPDGLRVISKEGVLELIVLSMVIAAEMSESEIGYRTVKS